ncbi:MAG: quinone-dependent dihydroorotate dehydrogenase [Alphaproteobacteria bacterium]|nr:quinone-dependent dihydroorotate dehydrogenase [Alphaproteobacteria bacterium]
MTFYRLARPLLFALEPERAHRLALAALRWGLVPADRGQDDPILSVQALGRTLSNPLGLAPGIDKGAEAIESLSALGFALIEVGGVTLRQQAGNPRPRLFRLVEDRALINRMGFNNPGLDVVAARLAARRGGGMVGVNIGLNKDSTAPEADYAACVAKLSSVADFLTVNVSSPNTPGLRALQRREALDAIVRAAQAARARPVPLLVKIAPDLDQSESEALAEVALARGIDGLVVSNTTLARPPGLLSPLAAESGGLSGPPLFAASTALLARIRRLTAGRLLLIGVGGVSSGADAYAKIRAGASLVQLYTAMIYQGPGIAAGIKSELAALLRRDGFVRLSDAIGVDVR